MFNNGIIFITLTNNRLITKLDIDINGIEKIGLKEFAVIPTIENAIFTKSCTKYIPKVQLDMYIRILRLSNV